MLILPDEFSIFNDFEVDYHLFYQGPMPYCNHEALAISIYKWQAIVKEARDGHLMHDGGTNTCGLCFLHHRVDQGITCRSCPVFEKTGFIWCHETPYSRCTSAWVHEDIQTFLSTAEEELAFLEFLWPEMKPHEEEV